MALLTMDYFLGDTTDHGITYYGTTYYGTTY